MPDIKSPEQGAAGETAQPTGIEKLKAALKGIPPEKQMELIGAASAEDGALKERALSDPLGLWKELTGTPEATPATSAGPAASEKTPAPGEKPPEKKPEEVLADTLKAKEEAEKGIKFYAESVVPDLERRLTETTANFQKQIDDLKKAPPAPAAHSPAPLTPDMEAVNNLIKETEGEDLLDEKAQKAVREALRKTVGAYNAMAQRDAEKDARLKRIEDEIGGVKKSLSENPTEKEEDRQVGALKQLREKYQGKGFSSKRGIDEINTDYIRFLQGLRLIGGVKEEIHQADGHTFTLGIQDAYRKYHNPVMGKELRDKMDAQGVKLPQDFDDLVAVMAIRDIAQNNYKKVPGSDKLVQYTLQESYEKYMAGKIPAAPATAPDTALAAQKAEMEAREKAAAEARKPANETGAKDGAPLPVDFAQFNTEWNNLWAKQNKTAEDKDRLRMLNKMFVDGSGKTLLADEEMENALQPTVLA